MICREKLRKIQESESEIESHKALLSGVPDELKKEAIECIERVKRAERKAEEERSELLTERRKKQNVM